MKENLNSREQRIYDLIASQMPRADDISSVKLGRLIAILDISGDYSAPGVWVHAQRKDNTEFRAPYSTNTGILGFLSGCLGDVFIPKRAARSAEKIVRRLGAEFESKGIPVEYLDN